MFNQLTIKTEMSTTNEFINNVLKFSNTILCFVRRQLRQVSVFDKMLSKCYTTTSNICGINTSTILSQLPDTVDARIICLPPRELCQPIEDYPAGYHYICYQIPLFNHIEYLLKRDENRCLEFKFKISKEHQFIRR